LPKNYQISQKGLTLGYQGYLDVEVNDQTKRVRIADVHLEEDAGKLLHPEHDPSISLVDLNRAGVPLLEIVSEPDMHSLDELHAYMVAIREILMHCGISDCRMEQGSLRFEAGVSVRPQGSTQIGIRGAEIKNLNSFRTVLRAVEYEIKRQTGLWERGERVVPETRLWDEERGVTEAMRTKEESKDYRYFPEPDLVPVIIDDARLERLRASLPELPSVRRARFVREYGIPTYDAGVLTATREMADFYEEAVRLGGDPKAVSNWMMGDLSRLLNAAHLEIAECKIRPQHLVELLQTIEEGTISGKIAKEVFEKMFATGDAPRSIIEREGLRQITDTSALEGICEQVIAENQDAVENYRKGKTKAIRFLIGQVMKATRGQANPQLVEQLLKQKMEAS
ncbi:MAG TPA: Asp-tRNA(Asn)/Glu-tRNA(Gln) amidotransferase subunit GatB, partial [Armatimonadetes bacterium]|nr:Asp-tRNA(Asn)/Glu-tRNA(Gln) amidotransferase subunit GatB [Armatimonadota bacterium]